MSEESELAGDSARDGALANDGARVGVPVSVSTGGTASSSGVMQGILRTMRPRQWVKNFFVLLPVVFAKGMLDAHKVVVGLEAFACFCAASSAVYLLNDLRDLEADRAHPKKRFRPIAAGLVPEAAARAAFAVLAVGAVFAAAMIRWQVAALIAAYLVLNVAYTVRLKRVAYVDVLCIAAGFELRLFAGAMAVEVVASTYLVAVTLSLACFLGFGKRMHELLQGSEATKQRAVLQHYAERPLRVLLVVNGLATIVVYAMGTVDSHNLVFFGSSHLVYTTVFTALGIARFVYLVTHHPEAESPTEEMLHDKLFLANLVAWFVTVLAIIYAGR